MELDIYFPDLHLAFEYQGEQHFLEIPYFGGREALLKNQKRDAEKRAACKKAGIVLIEIPYTWDGTEEYVRKALEANDVHLPETNSETGR